MGGSATAVVAAACGVPEKELLVQSSIEMPEDMVTGLDNWYATIDRQNRAPLGVVVRVMEGRAKKVEGNVDYPVNRGKHNAVAEAGLQGLYHPDRIGSPLIRTGERGEGKWEQLSWTDAVSRVAEQLGAASGEETVLITDPVTAHIGLVVGRFAEKLGAKHMSYEPLERTVLRTSMKQVFDQDAMPDFDIENAAYILSFGADFLNTWESPVRYARGYGHFRQGENRKRGKLVHFDSRFSMTAANSDEWVYVKPGYEGEVALAIANVMIAAGLPDSPALHRITGQGSNRLASFTPEAVGSRAGVDPEKIVRIARDFLEHPPGLAIGGGSAGAHSNGLFNLNAVYALNYLSGSVDQLGGVTFNPSPPISDLPTAPDVTSFSDFRDLTGRMSGGQVKALLVRNADPFYGLPENTGIARASFNVPLIVSFSNRFDDTTMMADIILPENHYLEDWGTDIPDPGPGYQTIGFQQPVVRPFFEPRGPHLGTKNFGDVLMTLAQVLEKDLGLDADNFKGLMENDARRLRELDRGSVRAANDKLFWNTVLQRGGWWDTNARGEGHDPRSGQYSFPTAAQTPSTGGSGNFHLIPFETTGLTDGRGADLPWLQATPDPITTATWQTWVEINLKKAEEMGIKEGDVVEVTSEQGSIEALAYPHPGISPDVVAIPVGQGHKGGGRYSKDRGANVLSILSPVTESETGALAWAATRVNVKRTGEWIRLPKFENTAPDLAEDGHRRIIPLSSG
jgi:anaerobic selenocysteine-containing dehydrogenase